jgi:hypothetical protein
MKSVSILFALAALTGISQAQITSITPFTGAFNESFETQQAFSFDPCVIGHVFGGRADLCANPAHITNQWASSCLLDDHGGDFLFGTVDGSATYTFEIPMRRLGGYFANNLTANSISVRFFDEGGLLMATEQVSVPDNCQWNWRGWETDYPFWSVQLEPDVGRVMMDDMEADPYGSLHASFCTAAPNSTGFGAEMAMSGSTSIAANDLVLNAGPIPPGEPGIFYYGQTETQIPFGDGFRCIGTSGPGTVFRLFPFVTPGALGNLSYNVDNQHVPAGSPGAQLLAGSTWKFQAWYRDPAAGGAGFNLSDGLSLFLIP